MSRLWTFVWGSGGSGQLGLGGDDDFSIPQHLPTTFENVMKPHTITTGGCHSAGLTKDGVLYLWGDNERLQLARPHHEHRLLEPAVLESTMQPRIVSVACGWSHTLAVSEQVSGDADCSPQAVLSWGANDNCQLGRPSSIESRRVPAVVVMPRLLHPRRVISISCGWKHSLLVLDDSTVFAWGSGRHGELGLGRSRRTATEPSQVVIPPGFTVEKAYCGWQHSILYCSRSGAVLACGNNRHGQLGVSPVMEGARFEASRVMQKDGQPLCAQFVSVGWHFSLCITGDGLFGWGKGTHGQLGLGAFENVHLPTRASFNEEIVSIACGSEHSMLVTAQGELFTCGWGEHGNLGHGDHENRSTFTKVEFFSENSLKVISATAGGAVSIAQTESAS